MARLEWERPAKVDSRTTMPAGRHGIEARYHVLAGASPATSLSLPAERHLQLDAIADPYHWTYKIPGSLVLATLLAFLIVSITDPDGVFWVVQILGFYLLLRFLVIVLFYPIGQWRIRRAEQTTSTARKQNLAIPEGLTTPVHHVVIVANFEEPEAIIARTLHHLAAQANARDMLTVVLAMEDAEPDARDKGERLAAQFKDSFARTLITVHPAHLPGEVAGKGSNLAWAARQAKQVLVGQLGLALDSLTVTACDADSLIHPRYFDAMTRQFAANPQRHECIWQAPFRFNTNIWSAPAPIRLLGFLNNLIQVSELANPLAANLPLSTYTLSYKLADDIGYWDEMVIADDWHIFLRGLFGTDGRLTLEPVFLPAKGDAVTGVTEWDAFRNFYKQRRRHAWGSSDIAYVVQQWKRWPDVPSWAKSVYLLKVAHDHVVFPVAGLLLGVGSILLVLQHGLLAVAAPIPGLYTILLQSSNIVSASGTAAAWLFEHMTSRKACPGWRLRLLAAELVTWPLLAPLSLLLVITPTFEAQFRQMLGGDLAFWRTPKKAVIARTD